MNILIIGAGGREHAFASQISKSKLLSKLYIAPGNPGTAQCGTNLNIAVNDFNAIKKAILEYQIKLLIVGPEDPLVNGIVDFLKEDHALAEVAIIGPGKWGAQLEGSKDFSKQFMMRHQIPTAKYRTFNAEQLQQGIAFLNSLHPPYVLKADGLAAGKGVIICNEIDQAIQELTEMLQNLKFGNASAKVVIEEYLNGIELSTFILTDGKHYITLPEAKDYKRIGNGDTGLNTGGMGAVSPVPFATPEFMQKFETQIAMPTIEGLKKEQIPYVGFIFIGLMNVNGNPFVIEYNCRMGDPETEAVLPRIKTDLLEILIKTAQGKLNEVQIETDSRTAATVVMVSGGYPEAYKKGYEITGLEEPHNSLVFHAGTQTEKGKVVTNGGRVIAVTSLEENLIQAFQESYKTTEKIIFSDKYQRTDLGKDLLKYLN